MRIELEGIIAASTGISRIDGINGRLFYRGINIDDLAKTLRLKNYRLVVVRSPPQCASARKLHTEIHQ
jgi:citrate synthase